MSEQATWVIQSVKALVRDRDGYCCTQCKLTNEQHILQTGRQFEVHRVQPGSDYAIDGCITLCKTCHGPQPKSLRGSGNNKYRLTQIPLSIYQQIVQIARQEFRPVSWQIRHFLEESIHRHDARD